MCVVSLVQKAELLASPVTRGPQNRQPNPLGPIHNHWQRSEQIKGVPWTTPRHTESFVQLRCREKRGETLLSSGHKYFAIL